MGAARLPGFMLVAACAAVAAALALPSPASAHLRSGVVAVDYRARIVSSNAALRTAVAARILESDRALELTVRPGHSVVVLGDLGEPVLRLDGAGLAVNLASPTAAASGLAERSTSAPGTAVWRLERGRRSVVWHDARVQGLASGSWSIPLVVDGRRTRLDGTVRRLPASPPWPWALAATLAIASAALLAAGRRRLGVWPGAVAFAAVAGLATIATAAVFAFGAYASPGTWIAGADEAAFAAVGLGVLAWGNRLARAFAAVGLGLLGLAVGASKGAVFLHPLVLAAVPSAAARLAVLLDLAAGACACLLCAVACLSDEGLRRLRQPEHLRRRPPVGSSPR